LPRLFRLSAFFTLASAVAGIVVHLLHLDAIGSFYCWSALNFS
jgi:hypothetical protein